MDSRLTEIAKRLKWTMTDAQLVKEKPVATILTGYTDIERIDDDGNTVPLDLALVAKHKEDEKTWTEYAARWESLPLDLKWLVVATGDPMWMAYKSLYSMASIDLRYIAVLMNDRRWLHNYSTWAFTPITNRLTGLARRDPAVARPTLADVTFKEFLERVEKNIPSDLAPRSVRTMCAGCPAHCPLMGGAEGRPKQIRLQFKVEDLEIDKLKKSKDHKKEIVRQKDDEIEKKPVESKLLTEDNMQQKSSKSTTEPLKETLLTKSLKDIPKKIDISKESLKKIEVSKESLASKTLSKQLLEKKAEDQLLNEASTMKKKSSSTFEKPVPTSVASSKPMPSIGKKLGEISSSLVSKQQIPSLSLKTTEKTPSSVVVTESTKSESATTSAVIKKPDISSISKLQPTTKSPTTSLLLTKKTDSIPGIAEKVPLKVSMKQHIDEKEDITDSKLSSITDNNNISAAKKSSITPIFKPILETKIEPQPFDIASGSTSDKSGMITKEILKKPTPLLKKKESFINDDVTAKLKQDSIKSEQLEKSSIQFNKLNDIEREKDSLMMKPFKDAVTHMKDDMESTMSSIVKKPIASKLLLSSKKLPLPKFSEENETLDDFAKTINEQSLDHKKSNLAVKESIKDLINKSSGSSVEDNQEQKIPPPAKALIKKPPPPPKLKAI